MGMHLTWLCTNRCNRTCSYCWNSLLRFPSEDELTVAECTELLGLLVGGFGLDSITLSGGEPFARPDLLELIGRLLRLGLKTKILSNGDLITPAAIGELARLSADGPLSVVLSLGRERNTKTYSVIRWLVAADVRLAVSILYGRDGWGPFEDRVLRAATEGASDLRWQMEIARTYPDPPAWSIAASPADLKCFFERIPLLRSDRRLTICRLPLREYDVALEAYCRRTGPISIICPAGRTSFVMTVGGRFAPCFGRLSETARWPVILPLPTINDAEDEGVSCFTPQCLDKLPYFRINGG